LGYQSTSSASSQAELRYEGSIQSMSNDSISSSQAVLLSISKRLETAEREAREKERELEETRRAMQDEFVKARKAVEEVVQRLQNDQREQIELARSFREQELLTREREPVTPVKNPTPFHGRSSFLQLSRSNLNILNSPTASVLQLSESNVNVFNSPTLFSLSSDSEVEFLESSVGEPDEVQMESLVDKESECGGVELMMKREGVVFVFCFVLRQHSLSGAQGRRNESDR
jgi:hypothetical protein